MKLQEVFDQLTYGELSQLSIGGGEQGVIAPANYDRVLAHINLGLTALHKRFCLKEGQVTLEVLPGVTRYQLHSKYAVNGKNSRELVRYIKDTAAAPFKDDVHKVERVYADSGYEFVMNDVDDPLSVRTTSSTMLEIPELVASPTGQTPDDLNTEFLKVVYRANHPMIRTVDGELDPTLVEVDLPYSHLEPLLLFVASRAHTPTGMVGEFNSGNNYMQKYEMSCQEIERTNLVIDQGSQSDRASRNGWV